MQPAAVGELIDAAIGRNTQGLAIVDEHRRLTYAGLDDEVARATRTFADAKVRRGTTVAASGANGVDIIVAFLATMRLGARWVGINRAATDEERNALLKHCRARLWLTDREEESVGRGTQIRTVFTLGGEGTWRGAVGGARAMHAEVTTDPLAPAAIAYTSGTTGRPKGVVHSQHNLTLPGRYLGTTTDFDDTSVIGVALPLTALNVIAVAALPALIAGRPCIAVPKLEAATVAHWVAREGITNMSLPPPVLYDLATRDDIRPEELASLRSPRTGGSAMPETTRAMFTARFGREVVRTYGLTEAPALVAVEARDQPRAEGASGRVLPYLDVRIVDADDRAVATGESGEICVTASSRGEWRDIWRPMLGYWRRPGASRAALAGGVLRTGDIGRLDAEGNLYVLDRKGNMLNRGGDNVYPAEVERVLQTMPGVAHSAVVGVPDSRLGERVAAAIETVPDVVLSPHDVMEHCRPRLARYKVPEIVVFVPALPRNSTGKVILPAVRAEISAALEIGSDRSVR